MYFHSHSFGYTLERDCNVTLTDIKKNPLILGAETVSCLPPADINHFEHKFRQPLKPVILTGSIQNWKAFKDWQDLNYIKYACQDQEVSVTQALILDVLKMQRHPSYWLLSKKKRKTIRESLFKKYKVGQFIDILLDGDADTRLPYARNIDVPEPLKEDIGSMELMGSQPIGMSIFIGRRSYTDCHEHHGSDVLMCQVRGSKLVVLFPPDDVNAKALYANPLFFKNWSPVRLFEDELVEFKNFQLSQPLLAIVHPGDALYIPNPWWHAVISMDDEVGITVPLWYHPKKLRLTDPQTRWLLLWPPKYRDMVKQNIEDIPKWYEVLKSATLRELLLTFLAAPLRLLS